MSGSAFTDLLPQLAVLDTWPDDAFPSGSRATAILALQTLIDGLAAHEARSRRVERARTVDAALQADWLTEAMRASSPMPALAAALRSAPSSMGRRLHQGTTTGGKDPAVLRWAIWATEGGTRLELTVEQSLPEGCEARAPRSGAGPLTDLLAGLKCLGSELSDEFARPVRRGTP